MTLERSPKTPLAVLFCIVGILGLSRPLAADTIYFENFNAATPGQSLLAPPLNWTPSIYGGNVFAGPTAHPGWDGNAVVGSLSAPWTYHYVNRDLPGMPTTGLITLTFDAWANDVYSGGVISLKTAGDGSIQLNPWWNITPGWNRIWTVNANAAFSGAGAMEAVSPQNFMRNTTVRGALHIDYEAHQFWGTLTDANGTYTFNDTRFAFVGNPQIIRMEILQDLRWPYPGLGGTDYDNITITHTPAVPEPASLLLLGTGLIGAVRAVRKRRG